jgi:hypothetical protein
MGSIIKLASDYGVPFTLLMLFGYCLFLYGKHRLLPRLGKVDPNIKLDNTANISYHSLFANINHRLNNEIPVLDLLPHKPVKQQMFRDILSIFAKTLFKTCKEITELDMNLWSSDKWCDEIIRRLNTNTITFVDLCKDNGVPEIVMTKFIRWYLPMQDIMFDNIMALGNSNIFNNNISRTNTLFFMLNLLLVTTIADAEKTLKELNGDIHGKMYKGQIIEK